MIYIWVEQLHCGEETDEVGADEPYVVVLSVDLKNTITVQTPAGGATINVPASAAFLYGPFPDVDAGETPIPPFEACWGLNSGEKALADPNDAIIIAALMENDDGHPAAARTLVADTGSATLLAAQGAPRGVLVARLLEAVRGILRTPTGAPNFDDVVDVQEVRFAKDQLDLAETGQTASLPVFFNGDGGRYSVTFGARMRGESAWRFCTNCHSMFFEGVRDNQGVCPAGGPHVSQGFRFFLPHDRPARPGSELGWGFCQRCFAMFRQGTGLGGHPGDPGVCPAGPGGHQHGLFHYVLPLSSHPGTGQDAWARCGNCRALFFDGAASKGRCAAVPGGGHQRALTLQGKPAESLKLDFEP